MRCLALLALWCIIAGSAWAVGDSTPDLLGLYFDETADVYCQEWVAPFTPLFMYAVYSNPSVPEIIGFDFGLDMPANVILLEVMALCGNMWLPISPGSPYVIPCDLPFPVGPTTTLVRFTFLPLTSSPTFFSLQGTPDSPRPEFSPGVWLPGGDYLPVQVHGGVDGPTAMMFVLCTVDNQPSTWDALKATYR